MDCEFIWAVGIGIAIGMVVYALEQITAIKNKIDVLEEMLKQMKLKEGPRD